VLLGIGLGYVAQCSMRDLGWIGKGDVLLFDHLFYYDPLKKFYFIMRDHPDFIYH
jgi:hypothetical protein